MQNPIKTTYNFIKNLKQFHAVHIFIIPPTLFWIVAYLIIFIITINSKDTCVGAYFFSLFSFFLYYLLVVIFLFIAILVQIIIFVKQKLQKRKIRVTSNFLLNNRFYNFIYLWNIIFLFIHIIVVSTNTPCPIDNYVHYLFFFPYSFLFH